MFLSELRMRKEGEVSGNGSEVDSPFSEVRMANQAEAKAVVAAGWS